MLVMKYLYCLILILIIHGCNTNEAGNENKLRKKALSAAENYATENVNSKARKVFDNGMTAIGDEEKMYVIDPAKVWVGLIDDNTQEDVLMTLDVFTKGYQNVSEQLIFISGEGKLMLNKVLESDMKILKLKDRKITAEVPEHSRNSPLFNCPACREVVTYIYDKGNLVKAE
jgi:PBP1b-binding outer membrane lipoprotein LpoB